MAWTLAWSDGVAEGKYPKFLAQRPGPSHDWQGLPVSCSSALPRYPSHSHMHKHALRTEIPFSGICGHSLCALMGKRHPNLPLTGPCGLWTLEKLMSKAIRVLLSSGPVVASFGPRRASGLWVNIMRTTCNLGLSPSSFCFPWCELNSQRVLLAPQDLASHSRRKLIGRWNSVGIKCSM